MPAPQPLQLTDAIIAHEQDELDFNDTIALFQNLIDTGLAWSLQGCYGRKATALIRAGHCTPRARGVVTA